MNSLFARVVFRDALARFWAAFLAICCTALAFTTLFGHAAEGLEGVRLALVVFSLIFGVVMVLRVSTIAALLMRGAQAEGRVSEAPASAGGPVITSYTFMHDNERVEGKAFMVQGFEPGQRITVAFDPERPEVSVIKDLFT